MDTKNTLITNISSTPTIQQTGQHNVNVTNQPGGNVSIFNGPPIDYDEKGIPYTPITPVRFDREKNIIYLGNEKVKLQIELIQPGLLAPQELPYINALCEVYAEKLGLALGTVTPDTISTDLPKNLLHHYSSQRKAYYQAEFVKRMARETFSDGDKQFSILKEDAFTGIEDAYYDDHSTGYGRLKAVLERITIISLTKSALINLVGLIGNLEKKGLCHILVNDDIIKSWVNIDE